MLERKSGIGRCGCDWHTEKMLWLCRCRYELESLVKRGMIRALYIHSSIPKARNGLHNRDILPARNTAVRGKLTPHHRLRPLNVGDDGSISDACPKSIDIFQ